MNYTFSRQFLNDCAAVFTIGAFALAAYAVLNPAALSEYIDEIANNTKIGSAALEKVQVSSEQVANSTTEILDDTRRMAAAVPYWLKIREFQHGHVNMAHPNGRIVIENSSNFAVRDVRVAVFSAAGLAWINVRDLVVPPLETLTLKFFKQSGAPDFICLSGWSDALPKPIHEYRKVGLTTGQKGARIPAYSEHVLNDEAIAECD